MANIKTILIAGPTASGKSQLAIDLAMQIDGVIINADSMQVYKNLSILTARPQLNELSMAPHLLYGFVPGEQAYSVGRFVEDAHNVIAKSAVSGQIPIFVGGTGLYFKALLNGLSPTPQIPLHIRHYWRTKARQITSRKLYETLCNRDYEMARRLQPSDRQRIVRALEVLDATGKSLAYWQQIPGASVLPCAPKLQIVLNPERKILNHNCEVRLKKMIAHGAIEEVETLSSMKLNMEMPIMRALGVQPLLAHLQDRINLQDAIETTQAETRRYIKRQLTWFRKNMSTWSWVSEQQSKLLRDDIIRIVR
ncbi:MAG: tRNA (adenosine(37)-N6)-dimethylallyltransferase MiaA [Hyphomicrobiaceae bacterium]|nr:tRNA (adenosine(37)-N6)-dimethylallyltransferase MiaA [Hyphomicrobiaceae bacterium]